MNDARASFRRLLQYLIPVVIFSVIFNVPKFFESEYQYDRNSTDPEAELYLEVTDFRKNPNYAIYYNNWTRLIVLGIIPFCLLVYFNSKIYKDIKVNFQHVNLYFSCCLVLYYCFGWVQISSGKK